MKKKEEIHKTNMHDSFFYLSKIFSLTIWSLGKTIIKFASIEHNIQISFSRVEPNCLVF